MESRCRTTHDEKCDDIRDTTSSIKMSLAQLVNRNNWKVLSYLRDFRKSPMILSPSLEIAEKIEKINSQMYRRY